MKILTTMLLVAISATIFAQNLTHRDSVDVLKYEINLEILLNKNQVISGNTKLVLTPTFDKTQNIKLDLLGLEIDSIYLSDNKLNTWKYSDETIKVNFGKEFFSNDTLEITVFYGGNPQKDRSWGGFYSYSFIAFNMGVGMAAYPHGFGRVWYPCIDNFTDKAIYNYNITVSDEKMAVCSGILKNVTENENNTKTFHWEISDEIPTYLSSVSVSKYELLYSEYEGINGSIPVDIYVFKKDTAEAKKAFKDLHKAIRIFEEKFGAYAWQRVGFVETNFRAGAMEHATNIAYPQFAIKNYENFNDLWVHELSHSWFGNLVTCKTSQDMWLNEGWASYCESVFREEFYGIEDAKKYTRKNHFNVLTKAHLRDGGYYAIAGISPTNTYGKTIYDKGASVVHTLRGYMGDSLFFDASKKYLQEFAYANASIEDLKNSFSKSLGINLDDFFDFWLNSPGFTFFEITDWKTQKKQDKFISEVTVNQSTVEAYRQANSNRVEVFFMDKNFNFETKLFEFSGESFTQKFETSFEPKLVMLDIDEKIADATIDSYQIIQGKTGELDFPLSQIRLNIKKNDSKIFVRPQACFIRPEGSFEGYMLDDMYWKIDSYTKKTFEAEMYFFFDKMLKNDELYKNQDVIKNYPNDIILLYRPDSKSKWEKADFTVYFDTNWSMGSEYALKTDKFKSGEYVIGIKK